MKIIAFANQKGGVGKTMESVHLSFMLEEVGYRVLHLDLDPQANSTKTLTDRRVGKATMELFGSNPVSVPDNEGITLFEATQELLDLDKQPSETMFRLREQLKLISNKFDFCVIDSPPALGFRMTAALITADYVVSPIELDAYSIDGISKMLTTIFGIKQKANENLEFIGMLANRFNPHSIEQKKVFEKLVSNYAQFMIPAKITTRTSIAEALSNGVPVWQINKSSAREAAKEMRHALSLIMEKNRCLNMSATDSLDKLISGGFSFADLQKGGVTKIKGEPLEIPLEDIEPDPNQPRKKFDQLSLEGMAESIRQNGVLEPIGVRSKQGSPGKYIINFGERRWRSSRIAGKRIIPAFLNNNFNPYIQMIENIEREELEPIEIANWIKTRIDAGEKKGVIAKKLGKDSSFVTIHCSLLELPDQLRSLYDKALCTDVRALYDLKKLYEQDSSKVSMFFDSLTGPISQIDVHHFAKQKSVEMAQPEISSPLFSNVEINKEIDSTVKTNIPIQSESKNENSAPENNVIKLEQPTLRFIATYKKNSVHLLLEEAPVNKLWIEVTETRERKCVLAKEVYLQGVQR